MPGFFSLPGCGTFSSGGSAKKCSSCLKKPAQFTAPPSGLFGKNILYDGDTVQDMRLPVFVGFRKVIAFAQAAVDESVFKKPGGSHERLCRKISRG